METVFYEKTNLLKDEIDFVAIEREDNLYFLFATYRTNGSGIEGIPSCVREHPNLFVLPIEQAKEKYDFKKVKNSRLGRV